MKRFTDTEKWFDSWFRTLPTDYKLFWVYLCDRCNNAGVWKIDLDLANFVMFGKEATGITLEKAWALYGDRIHPLRPGYWLLRGFVPFQFGDLSPTNRMHLSVLNLIEKEGANKALNRPIPRGQEKEKGKVKDKKGSPEGKVKHLDFVWLSRPDYNRLAERIGYHLQGFIERLNGYIGQIGEKKAAAKYTSHYHTILNWYRKDIEEGKIRPPQPAVKPKEKPVEILPAEATADEIMQMHKMTVSALGRCSTKNCQLCPKIEDLEAADRA